MSLIVTCRSTLVTRFLYPTFHGLYAIHWTIKLKHLRASFHENVLLICTAFNSLQPSAVTTLKIKHNSLAFFQMRKFVTSVSNQHAHVDEHCWGPVHGCAPENKKVLLR